MMGAVKTKTQFYEIAVLGFDAIKNTGRDNIEIQR